MPYITSIINRWVNVPSYRNLREKRGENHKKRVFYQDFSLPTEPLKSESRTGPRFHAIPNTSCLCGKKAYVDSYRNFFRFFVFLWFYARYCVYRITFVFPYESAYFSVVYRFRGSLVSPRSAKFPYYRPVLCLQVWRESVIPATVSCLSERDTLFVSLVSARFVLRRIPAMCVGISLQNSGERS